jgi:hypothetical protein
MTDRTGRTNMICPFIEEDRRKIRSSAREPAGSYWGERASVTAYEHERPTSRTARIRTRLNGLGAGLSIYVSVSVRR